MRLKKLAAVLMSVACLLLSSCGEPEVAGDNLINDARDAYTKLDSAKVVMTNVDTGEVDQTFIFKYDEKDVLMYSYFGKNGKEEYAQYNNGAECYSYENGKYTHTVKGDKDFQKYTRKAIHPQADKGLIFFTPKYIKNASMKEKNGITHVVHIYDPEKIAKSAKNDNITAFSVEYYFDKDGKLLYFIESNESKEDGKTKTYSYKIEITEQNSVDKIENTVEKYKPDE